ncbi:hypothetical protein Q5424_25430 [Conexibacter sp. JD483]|uniref:hypothetical protein n=1 Tax=unclassified Conexibacter TaxID=2627773 RepID=UPI002716727F|nr:MULTISPECIES: hypothetical protein [unclassified Conexibacter]MDO8188161.1 hypothetical protein [Conexibacter sp. CPCC 205706]MDO8202005.1 hypothetical protein [Conexibacter sp. CPCC 205762]MDR9372465.1 hypothetical protein [Conexibacter sp. JD483]
MNRTILRLCLLAAALLLLPATARADDRSFATTAVQQAQKLARFETATGRALVRVDKRGRSAIPAARRAAAATRAQIDRALRPVRAASTSSPGGAAVKRRFVALLVAEKKAYTTVDRSLAAFQSGDVRTGNTLQARAKKAIERVRKAAVKLAPRLRSLIGA